MFHVRRECGHCHQLGDQQFVFAMEMHPPATAVREGAARENQVYARTIKPDEHLKACALAWCPLCGMPSLLIFDTERQYLPRIVETVGKREAPLFGGQSLVNIQAGYPKPDAAQDRDEWPREMREIFIDAQDMLRQGKSPSIIIATCRSVLEVAVKQLGGKGRDLNARIDDLAARHLITEPLRRWAHHVRIEGNEAVHEIAGTKEEAVELVEFVRMFLDMTFTLPKRISEKTLVKPPAPLAAP